MGGWEGGGRARIDTEQNRRSAILSIPIPLNIAEVSVSIEPPITTMRTFFRLWYPAGAWKCPCTLRIE